MRQPQGARELIALRLAGKVPVPHVVVTDAPIVSRLNRVAGIFSLLAGPGEWDMRCVHGLQVIVWCFGDDLLGLVESVAQAAPSELGVMSWKAAKAFPRAFAEAA